MKDSWSWSFADFSGMTRCGWLVASTNEVENNEICMVCGLCTNVQRGYNIVGLSVARGEGWRACIYAHAAQGDDNVFDIYRSRDVSSY